MKIFDTPGCRNPSHDYSRQYGRARRFKPGAGTTPGVTDRSSEADTPHPEAVRRSLRALAEGAAQGRDSASGATAADARPASVVDDAEHAADCARRAASFLSAGRLPELDRTIATAVRNGDNDIASRGRAARESLRRLDAALEGRPGAGPSGCASGRPDSSQASASDPSGSNRRIGADGSPTAGPRERDDHFHSGRGTVLRDTAQGSSR